MQILTDILSLFKRKKIVNQAKGNDLLVLGVHEQPKITGIASPVPYKDVRLIRVGDLLKPPCENANFPLTAEEAGVYLGEVQDPENPDICYYAFRRLKSLSLNLTIAENGEYVEFNTTAEPNQAANVGTGAEVWKDKLGEVLRFRTIKSPDNSISVNLGGDNNDEIHLATEGGSGGEINTASNLGAGVGVFKDKTGVDLEFNSLSSPDSSVIVMEGQDEGGNANGEIWFAVKGLKPTAGGGIKFQTATGEEGALEDAWDITSSKHIIPAENSAFDIGNAEYKVRHLFLSDTSVKTASGDLRVGPDDGETPSQRLLRVGELKTIAAASDNFDQFKELIAGLAE